MRRTVTGAALAAALASPLSAADSSGRYAAGYPASLECRAVSAAEPGSETLFAIAAFSEGWLAAHAKLTPGVFDLTPWQSIEYVVAQLRAYCDSRPEDRLLNALDQLTAFLEPDALAEGGTPVTVSNGQQVIMVHPETLERIRQKLVERGFSPADNDDPVAGLRAFQRDAGVTESGLPDQATLQRLFSP
ncbi:peptidoglycan-binding domain-containing protein [uncultured Roseobacter sp.]|uniref:peptidoglycan-binding domain-containing protein n=1 Tax=uncultured Roseobacter sp. TaxID=114847 RepID=UPI00260F5858|nr:peptidoglycan-binding domain-containing protein [uncultured Roseobacter sp.]